MVIWTRATRHWLPTSSPGSSCTSRPARTPAALLGLSIVRSITLARDGTIVARPRPDGGLIVEIELPVSSQVPT
jgi:signal transduction histidine kinase